MLAPERVAGYHNSVRLFIITMHVIRYATRPSIATAEVIRSSHRPASGLTFVAKGLRKCHLPLS